MFHNRIPNWKLFLSFLMVCSFELVISQSPEECAPEAMSKCTDPLKVVTDNKDLGFATSHKELQEMCPKLMEGLRCIDEFTLKCLDREHRAYFNTLYAGTTQVIIDLCQEGDYQTDYLRHAPCMRHVQNGYASNRMKSALVLLSLVAIGLSANVPVSKPAQQELHGRPFMHPELKSTQGHQTITCWENPGQGGSSVKLIDYAPNLGQYNFDNRATSCCLNGIWLLYDDYNYNANNFQLPAFNAWGENYCTNFDLAFDNKASSARLAGAPDGYKYDTLNFYDGEYYMGREQYLYGDSSSLNYDNFGRSLIVSGCSAWTLYQYDNYQGSCYCVFPSDQGNCYPGFYPTASLLGGFAQQVSSARRGCFCAKSLHPEVTLTKTGAVSQESQFVPQE